MADMATPPPYAPAPDRYAGFESGTAFRRCGRSGLDLPAVSLGLWHNFGNDRPLDTQRAILRRAFDLGITHFDLANNYGDPGVDKKLRLASTGNYGPPYGAAESNFGRILATDLKP